MQDGLQNVEKNLELSIFLLPKTFQALVPSGNNVLIYMFSDIFTVYNCTKRLRHWVKTVSFFVDKDNYGDNCAVQQNSL